jgi:hypothetical protein
MSKVVVASHGWDLLTIDPKNNYKIVSRSKGKGYYNYLIKANDNHIVSLSHSGYISLLNITNYEIIAKYEMRDNVYPSLKVVKT